MSWPNNPPLMWLQERTPTTPTIIGCTACNWTDQPNTRPTKGADGRRLERGWRFYELIFNTHLDDTHPEAITRRQPTITLPTDPRHGTRAGIRAHRRAGHDLCDLCQSKKRELDKAWRADVAARRAAKTGPRLIEEMAS